MIVRGKRRRSRWRFDADEEDQQGEDRISCLPDHLLHQIMSFMHAKYAVQTCVLSKRWQFVWMSLPCLDFDIETYPFKDTINRGSVAKLLSFNNFIWQVGQVLSQLEPINLINVCVGFHDKFFSAVFNALQLLRYALEHNVQQLTLISSCSYSSFLPQSLFNCKTLTTLTLEQRSLRYPIELPKLMVLPALRSLHVTGCQMTGENFDTIFSGCPNLESLKLFAMVEQSICVNSLNLKSLELSLYYLDTVNSCKRKILFDAPSLTTFKLIGHAAIPIECKTKNLASLHDVYIDIYPSVLNSKLSEKKYALLLNNTFKEFRHVKALTLSRKTFEILAGFPSFLEGGVQRVKVA